MESPPVNHKNQHVCCVCCVWFQVIILVPIEHIK